MSTTGGRLKHVGAGEVWSVSDASELYEVARWGKGYFSVSGAGHVMVHPTKDPSAAIDLKQLCDDLQARGINLPLLIRFSDILRHRLSDIHDAFKAAIAQHQYGGRYCCVYPIKVNQQRQVVEEVLNFGAPFRFGLEAGSKPELLAVIAMASNDTPIICNGFKDAEYIETVMLATKMGRNIIPVVEKYTELELILEYCEKVGVRPQIGMRVKLAARGGGRWQGSGGYRSKFGLTVGEILHGLEALKQRGMADCFKLLHFHLGSQIPNIRVVKHALNEAARIYTELHKAGAGLQYLDVGGGLGVDYDGSQTNFESSTNYTLEEYANDVVYHIQSVCDDAGVPHPTIVSESGRAVVAYHSVLVFNVLGVSGFGGNGGPRLPNPEEVEQPLVDLTDTFNNLSTRNALEGYHDAQQALDMALNLFSGGYLPAHAARPGRDAVLGDPAEAAEAGAADGRGPRGSAEPGRAAVVHLLLQLLAVPVHPGQLGHQAVVPGDADSPPAGAADRARRAGRHHLRQRRQDRPVHRSPRRQAHAAAARLRRRSLLPRRVPRRRVPGDPGRHAQPVRRHARRAHPPRRRPATSSWKP